jgi:site-specific recombinase XerD
LDSLCHATPPQGNNQFNFNFKEKLMSLQKVFARMSVIAHLESGPLGSYLSGLASALGEQRYAVHTIQKYMHAADAFGRWLTKQKIEIGDVDEQVVNRYVAGLQRRAAGSRSNLPSHLATGLRHLLQLFRQQGVIGPCQEFAPLSPTDLFLAAYRQHLERTLGSAPATVRQHLLFARRLIDFAFGTEAIDWAALSGETIAQFTLQQTERRSGFGRKAPGSSIRVRLRYLVTRGDLRDGLEAAVPKAREWKHASLPTYLSEVEVTKVLAACDDDANLGKRDLAILLLLSRLGLRAGEAIRLRIDDVDWAGGAVTIRAGKTHRERRLPLPQEIGQALIDYLYHSRPKDSPHREIFLTHTAPFLPLKDSSAIGKLVHRQMKRAEITSSASGAHLFRHTVATQMVRRGASFKDVADVLGHQSLQSTTLYAKLDLANLAQAALPWPGGER